MGRPVPTPGGPALLLQVLGESCRVLLPGQRATPTYTPAEPLRRWKLAAMAPCEVAPIHAAAAPHLPSPDRGGSEPKGILGVGGRRSR